jgi:hypothetical protein
MRVIILVEIETNRLKTMFKLQKTENEHHFFLECKIFSKLL